MTTKPTATSYIRFSASHQGKGSSVARQSAMFDKWLLEHPEFESSSLNRIDRGVSAYRGLHKNQGLGEVLKAIKDGRIHKGDALVIEALDRLSRQEFDEAYEVVREIVLAGVVIFTIEDNNRYDRDSLNGTAIYSFAAKVHANNEYSKRLSRRLIGSYDSKRQRVKESKFVNAPNRPMWIDKQGAVISGRSKIPLRAIDLYKQGLGQLELLKTLHKEFPDSLDLLSNEGTETEASEGTEEKRSKRTVLPATTRSIKRLLTNEALIGQWNGHIAFSAIISIAEFADLQRLVKNRTIPSKSAETYLLSGLLRCSECNGAYNFRTQKPRATVSAPLGSEAYRAKGTITYANCSNMLKSAKSKCKNTFTVPLEVAEVVFEQSCNDAIYSIASGFAMDSLNNREISDLQNQQRQLNSDIESVSRIYQITKKESELKRLQQYQDALDAVEVRLNRQNEIAAKIEAAKTPQTEFIYEDFLRGTPEQQEFHKATQDAMNELYSSTINLRNELKAYGFKIECGRPKDGSSNGVLVCGNNTYSIVRRSQKELCYIVSATEIDDFGDEVKFELKARRKPYKDQTAPATAPAIA